MLLALACSQGGGQQRGLFIAYVTDKTEDEVTAKVGKADTVDAETILILQKAADGKLRCAQVVFE